MIGRQDRDQRQLFYEFSLDEMILTDHSQSAVTLAHAPLAGAVRPRSKTL